VLLGSAGPLEPAHAALAPQVTRDLLEQVLAMVPDPWLEADGFDDASTVRLAYADVLLTRAQQPQSWLPEVEVARAAAV